jgi:Helix-turn-helix domain
VLGSITFMSGKSTERPEPDSSPPTGRSELTGCRDVRDGEPLAVEPDPSSAAGWSWCSLRGERVVECACSISGQPLCQTGLSTSVPAEAIEPDEFPICSRLRAGRLQASLPRHEVAERLGWSIAYLAAVEQGFRQPRLSDVVALAHVYGVDIEFFRPRARCIDGPVPVGTDRRVAGELADAA